MLVNILSYCLGLIDATYYILIRLVGSRLPKFFPNGWGDCSIAIREKDEFFEHLRNHDGHSTLFFNPKVAWAEIKHSSSITIKTGTFISPAAEHMPKESKECRFHLVEPASSSNKQSSSSVVVIMLPATGEAGRRERLAMATQLADDYGWSSAIITAPYYGSRKPHNQNLWFIDNANDFLLQSTAIIEEATALGCYFHNATENVRICYTGFSWGAAMTACVSVASMLAGIPGKRIACVPYVGSATPAVLSDGMLKGSVDWQALKKKQSDTTESLQKEACEMFMEFHLKHLLDILEHKKEHDTTDALLSLGVLRVVAMKHDHVIRFDYAKDMAEGLETRATTSQTISFPTQWLIGGHVIAALIKHRFQMAAIVDATKALCDIK